MTSVMYKAVTLDENGEARKEEELYQRLITENKVFGNLINYHFIYSNAYFNLSYLNFNIPT